MFIIAEFWAMNSRTLPANFWLFEHARVWHAACTECDMMIMRMSRMQSPSAELFKTPNRFEIEQKLVENGDFENDGKSQLFATQERWVWTSLRQVQIMVVSMKIFENLMTFKCTVLHEFLPDFRKVGCFEKFSWWTLHSRHLHDHHVTYGACSMPYASTFK